VKATVGVLLTCLVSASSSAAQDVALPSLLVNAETSYSADSGVTFASMPPLLGPRQSAAVHVKLEFDIANNVDSTVGSTEYAALTFSHDAFASVTDIDLVLNGHNVLVPLEGMNYRAVHGIDPGLLQPGENTLLVVFKVRNRSRDSELRFKPTIVLIPQLRQNLRFQTGPLLGAFGADYFTLTCRTNVPARVLVYRWEGQALRDTRLANQLDGAQPLAVTDLGLLHRLRVPREMSSPEGVFAVVAEGDGFRVGTTVRAPRYPSGRFSFLVLGDSRTNSEIWQGITSAAAVAAGDATLAVHVGDLVTLGTRDWEWDTQFWGPGRILLERLPFYPVIGNHEADAPLYDALFFGPAPDGGARNWVQELGNVLLIGIDGGQDWTAGSANALWLEETLSRSDAAFKFLFSHYPAWSSAGHGRLNEEGVPRERPSREARDVLIPMFARHGGTAYLAGHDHTYERSELPGGVTGITCGGGGAPLYEKTADAARQNPYSRVYAARHHYCLFAVDSSEVSMQVVSLEGDLIDTHTWLARD
jgi:hypothetical protein